MEADLFFFLQRLEQKVDMLLELDGIGYDPQTNAFYTVDDNEEEPTAPPPIKTTEDKQ